MMDKKNKKKFNLRSFTSFSLVFSTIIMSWSGFILYVAPPGRIANWGTWELMLFTKAEWQALHTIFSYLFFILFIIHLFFINWKAFLTYIKSKVKAGLNRKWELGTAVVLSTVIFIGTLLSWTPFGPVMAFGEKVKQSWDSKLESPPAIHMEIFNLEQLSLVFDSVPPAELLKTLMDNNIEINPSDTTLKMIAEGNNTTPASLYNILASKYKQSTGPAMGRGGGSGQGFGKYTLKMAAENSGQDLNDLILLLRQKGIEADGETSLRTIADKMGITPMEVNEMLIDH